MRLRTRLLIGILATLLLEIGVTGTFTLLKFLSSTRASRETDLRADWDRAASWVEELKHRLTVDVYQLSFFLREDQVSGAAPEELRTMLQYFISFTSADRLVVVDDPGELVADERAGAAAAGAGLPLAFLIPREFQFPRSRFISVRDVGGAVHLFLVTGTTIPRADGGGRHLYLITGVDADVVAAIREKTGTDVAFFVGRTPVIASSSWGTIAPLPPRGSSDVRLGKDPYAIYSEPLSADLPDKVYLVTFRSLLAQGLYVRSVLLSYLTAFLVTLAASLFLAAGLTSVAVSPFDRLSRWLHRYMETGEVGALAIRTRDEVGFLAEAFHSMVSTLIQEKRTIGAQLEQISVLHANNESIMNSIRAGVIVVDPEGAVEFCNSYFLELVGQDFAALRGRPVRDVLAKSFVSTAPLPQSLSGGREGRMEGLRREQPGEEPQNFTLKVSPLPLTGGRSGSLVVLEDITASERFWARMTVADKVTSLGVLSAGVAHEINNPLGSILSHVNYLKAVEREQDKLDSLTWIETETNRIASLVKRIRAYSAPGSSAAPCADLNAVAEATVGALRFLAAQRELRISVELSDKVGAVTCPTDELKQVALNILLNAVEACAPGGSIAVRSSRDDDGRALLCVTDDGAGIAADHMKYIFDPFFTTKGAGLGSGLGLSICWAIVTRNGGELRVQSAPGKGTLVEVVLLARERPDC